MRKIPDLAHEIRSLAEDGETELLRAEIIKDPGVINRVDEFGWSLLHRAVVSANADIVAMLLTSGADVNARDLTRNTPLHDAAGGYDAHLLVMALLVSAGATIDSRNTAWQSPIMVCAQSSNPTGFAFLLGCGAKLDYVDRYRRTILDELNYQLDAVPKSRKFSRQRQDLKAMIGWAEVLCNRKE